MYISNSRATGKNEHTPSINIKESKWFRLRWPNDGKKQQHQQRLEERVFFNRLSPSRREGRFKRKRFRRFIIYRYSHSLAHCSLRGRKFMLTSYDRLRMIFTFDYTEMSRDWNARLILASISQRRRWLYASPFFFRFVQLG